jgi:hypothetical protein
MVRQVMDWVLASVLGVAFFLLANVIYSAADTDTNAWLGQLLR